MNSSFKKSEPRKHERQQDHGVFVFFVFS